jgi:hypothetical protein
MLGLSRRWQMGNPIVIAGAEVRAAPGGDDPVKRDIATLEAGAVFPGGLAAPEAPTDFLPNGSGGSLGRSDGRDDDRRWVERESGKTNDVGRLGPNHRRDLHTLPRVRSPP